MYGEVAAYTKDGSFWQFVARCHPRAESQPAVGWECRTVQPDGRPFSCWDCCSAAGAVPRFGGECALGADADRRAVAFVPLQALHGIFGEATAARMAATVLDMWQKFAFTAVLVASFVLLYRTARFRRATDSLRFYGRMSFTNYIVQSVAGALIFFPFGLGLASCCADIR